jgi:hypothetical protein
MQGPYFPKRAFKKKEKKGQAAFFLSIYEIASLRSQ